MRRIRRAAGAFLLAGLSAASLPSHAATCPAPIQSGQVAAVLDEFDLALDDGREIRLAGLDPPRPTATHPRLAEEMRAALSAELAGRGVSLLPLAADPDRWDRLPALVWVGDAGTAAGTPSLAETLLGRGLGRMRPEPDVDGCRDSFLQAEARARAAGLGLWDDPYYAILDADDRDGLTRRSGGMAIVEGRLELGFGRARTYLRLGRRGGAVGTLSRRAARQFVRSGIDLGSMTGRRVRLRGFLDDRFGPRIEVTDAAQIEVIDGAAAGVPGGKTP